MTESSASQNDQAQVGPELVADTGLRTVVVVGNPKPLSKTRSAAELLTEQLTGRPAVQVIDVIDLGAGLLGWGDPGVKDAKKAVLDADLVIVASPTFKGTYTGVLKLFLDQFGAGELAAVTGVPLMLGAGPGHALAPELTLKPVLVEIGLNVPFQGLYLIDTDIELAGAANWLEVARRRLPQPRTDR